VLVADLACFVCFGVAFGFLSLRLSLLIVCLLGLLRAGARDNGKDDLSRVKLFMIFAVYKWGGSRGSATAEADKFAGGRTSLKHCSSALLGCLLALPGALLGSSSVRFGAQGPCRSEKEASGVDFASTFGTEYDGLHFNKCVSSRMLRFSKRFKIKFGYVVGPTFSFFAWCARDAQKQIAP